MRASSRDCWIVYLRIYVDRGACLSDSLLLRNSTVLRFQRNVLNHSRRYRTVVMGGFYCFPPYKKDVCRTDLENVPRKCARLGNGPSTIPASLTVKTWQRSQDNNYLYIVTGTGKIMNAANAKRFRRDHCIHQAHNNVLIYSASCYNSKNLLQLVDQVCS